MGSKARSLGISLSIFEHVTLLLKSFFMVLVFIPSQDFVALVIDSHERERELLFLRKAAIAHDTSLQNISTPCKIPREQILKIARRALLAS